MSSPRRSTNYDNHPMGWVIIGAAFITNVILMGNVKALGVLLIAIETDFSSHLWLIGWIATLHSMLKNVLGPLITVLIRILGSRFVFISGGIFGGIGLTLASQSTSVVQLAICLVLVSGVGTAFSGFCAFALMASYFEERYSVANAVSTAGFPIGMVVVGPVTQILLDTYGWRGVVLLLGGLSFNLVALGALVTTNIVPSSSKRYKEVAISDKDEASRKKTEEEVPTDSGSIIELSTKDDERKQDTSCHPDFLSCQKFSTMMDFSVLANPRFILVTLARCCSELCYTCWVVFIVSHGQFQGLSYLHSSLLPTAFGAGNFLGKLVVPLVEKNGFNPASLRLAFFVCSLLSVSFTLTALVNSFAGQMVSSASIGFGFGVFFQANDSLTKTLADDDRIINILGWRVLFSGFAGIFGGLLGGWLYEWTGSFQVTLFAFAGLTLLPIPLYCIDSVYTKKKNS
ncbi:monocarboxylate transporter 5-like [Asterias amurensis]|uniref:monocarboxylate transporter 5-like n=1 Tax=Asterias amurensis TaxID=7602 RepID=UPI003AB33630